MVARSFDSVSSPQDGLIVVVKHDCPTCTVIVPVLRQLATSPTPLTVYTQDDPQFPEGVSPVDDTSLEHSYRLGIQIVPTLIRRENNLETDRTYGWDRAEWERIAGVTGLGEDLPDSRPRVRFEDRRSRRQRTPGCSLWRSHVPVEGGAGRRVGGSDRGVFPS
jgi:hypothetical protein